MSPLFGLTYSLHLRDGRRTVVAYGALAGVGLLALLVGWLIAAGQLVLAILLCAAWPLVLMVKWAGPAAIAGVILILTLDGVPGLNLESLNVHGSFESIDLCAVALIVLASIRYLYGIREAPDRYARPLRIWSILLLVVWTIAFAKGLDRGVPALKAALFGRDFLFFAILLPLTTALIKNERELTRFLAAVGALTSIYAVGEIAASVNLIEPSIINATLAHTLGSLTRVYSTMNDLIALGFACGLSYALLHRGNAARWAAVIAIVCGAATVLQLTRALYIGLVVGMVIAFVVWATKRFPLRGRLRRRLAWTVVAMIIVGVMVALAAPQVFSGSGAETISNRVTEGVTDVGSSSPRLHDNTVAYREHVSSLMLHVLGSSWVLGLGFLHPAAVYYPQLPHGSIRNTDLGFLNGLMTVGVIGTILIYAPVLLALGSTLPRRSFKSEWDWLRLSGMIWLISVIAGSASLVTLFSPSGLILTAMVLGAMFRTANLRSARAPDPAPASKRPLGFTQRSSAMS